MTTATPTGPLLMRVQPKYGLLELKVASWLKRDDWMARCDLVLGLTDARLDDAARAELTQLRARWPAWRADRDVARADSLLSTRSGQALSVARF